MNTDATIKENCSMYFPPLQYHIKYYQSSTPPDSKTPQSLLTISKLIAVHCLAFFMSILQCRWWSKKPRIFDFHVEVVRRSYTASFWVWHLNKNHSPLPWYINNVDYREADQSQPRRLRIAIRKIEML